MTFDPVKQFIDQKKVYYQTRGIGRGGGGQGQFPLTTTLDAYIFAHKFFGDTQKSEDGTLEKGAQALAKAFGAGPTNSYTDSVKAWKATWPSFIDAATQPQKIWWNNLAFWDTGNKYAIARSAVGSVPGHWEMLKESVEEVVEDRLNSLVGLVDWSKWLTYGLLGVLAYKAVK